MRSIFRGLGGILCCVVDLTRSVVVPGCAMIMPLPQFQDALASAEVLSSSAGLKVQNSKSALMVGRCLKAFGSFDAHDSPTFDGLDRFFGQCDQRVIAAATRFDAGAEALARGKAAKPRRQNNGAVLPSGSRLGVAKRTTAVTVSPPKSSITAVSPSFTRRASAASMRPPCGCRVTLRARQCGDDDGKQRDQGNTAQHRLSSLPCERLRNSFPSGVRDGRRLGSIDWRN